MCLSPCWVGFGSKCLPTGFLAEVWLEKRREHIRPESGVPTSVGSRWRHERDTSARPPLPTPGQVGQQVAGFTSRSSIRNLPQGQRSRPSQLEVVLPSEAMCVCPQEEPAGHQDGEGSKQDRTERRCRARTACYLDLIPVCLRGCDGPATYPEHEAQQEDRTAYGREDLAVGQPTPATWRRSVRNTSDANLA